MALTKPVAADLDAFSLGATEVFTEPQKTVAIAQAADILMMVSGVTIDPVVADDGLTLRIIKYGILDMAWKLLVETDNKTEMYSPFSSERIGSYSYSKSQGGWVKVDGPSNVMWFDRAVDFLLEVEVGAGAMWYKTEQVFVPPYMRPSKYDYVPDGPYVYGPMGPDIGGR